MVKYCLKNAVTCSALVLPLLAYSCSKMQKEAINRSYYFKPPADAIDPESNSSESFQTNDLANALNLSDDLASTAQDGSSEVLPKIEATWNDYENVTKKATVFLPKQYYLPGEMFRAKNQNETDFDYLSSAVTKLQTTPHLIIPKGHYRVVIPESKRDSNIVLAIQGAKDKILDFSNSTISLFEPRTFLFISNSQRVVVKKLRVVHRFPLTSLGYLDFKNQQLLPRVSAPYLQRLRLAGSHFSNISAIYQAHEDILAGPTPFLWRKSGSSFRLIDENLIRSGIGTIDLQTGFYNVPNHHPLLGEIQKLGRQGTPLLIKHFTYGANGLSANQSRDITFEGITINGVAGMGFYISNTSSGILIRNCRIEANKSEDPLALFGSTADGIHLARVDENVIVRDNHVTDTGDDSLNVYHGNFFRVEAHDSRGVIVKRLGGGPDVQLRSDNVADVFSPNLSLKIRNMVISSFEELPKIENRQRFRLTHSQPTALMRPGNDFVAFKTPRTGKIFVGHNYFGNSTARGAIIQAKVVMLKENFFKNIARNAVKITSDTYRFYEFGLPENVKLFKNTIINTTWDHLDVATWSTSPSAINALVRIESKERLDRKPYGMLGSITNLSIQQNTVLDSPTSFGHWGVNGVKVHSNSFVANKSFLASQRSGSFYGWIINDIVFGEGSSGCQAFPVNHCWATSAGQGFP